MAVFPTVKVKPDAGAAQTTTAQNIDIQAWTEQTTQAMNNVTIASPGNGVRGTSVSLAIDLEEPAAANATETAKADGAPPRPRRRLLRRDSLLRREALLKGREGSRRRTRWENDRLLNNPWTEPPLPSDWEVHPTHPRHAVPYCLAPLWDKDMASKAESRRRERLAAQRQAQRTDASQTPIAKDLRGKLKKTKAAKGLLKDLEEEVRVFVQRWNESQALEHGLQRDSNDDEIVFVGRGGHTRDDTPSPCFDDSDDDEAADQRLIFDSLANDQGASFGRWLVHSIATYYGLSTWSLTAGDPARRQAFVGIPSERCKMAEAPAQLPTPLWVMI